MEQRPKKPLDQVRDGKGMKDRTTVELYQLESLARSVSMRPKTVCTACQIDTGRIHSPLATGVSVSEVATPSEQHGQIQAIGGGDDFCVPNRPARLYDRRNASHGGLLDAIGKREEGVRGHHRPLGLLSGLGHRQPNRVNPAHLSRSHAIHRIGPA